MKNIQGTIYISDFRFLPVLLSSFIEKDFIVSLDGPAPMFDFRSWRTFLHFYPSLYLLQIHLITASSILSIESHCFFCFFFLVLACNIHLKSTVAYQTAVIVSFFFFFFFNANSVLYLQLSILLLFFILVHIWTLICMHTKIRQMCSFEISETFPAFCA